MELKHSGNKASATFFFPLIVPYGIETIFVTLKSFNPLKPLIVPYGIETQKLII